MNNIRQGDVVYLRTSKLKPSVPMLVEYRDEKYINSDQDYATCIWFDVEQRLCKEDILVNILTRDEEEIM